MHEITLNSIISPVEGSAMLDFPVRVLGYRGDLCIVIKLCKNPTKPWLVDSRSLMAEIDSGLVVINVEQPAEFMVRTEDEISDREKQSRDRNWSLIEEFVRNRSPEEILASAFGSDVQKQASLVGVDRKQIYRLLYRYWSLGQVKNAFLWNTSACGAAGKKKNRTPGTILGRKPKYRGVIIEERAVALDSKHTSAIVISYGRYASRKCGTMCDCYQWMLNKFYRALKSDGAQGELIRGSYPTQRQFEYQGKKHFDDLYVFKGRRGEKTGIKTTGH
ncbi:hypothetical protein [Pseudomonas sp. NBRC 111128]|uniref:hypothetical protein n=1 Tax=Pseudomonas sp. NBRC 111128 TaxID=1661043 RepID=UPI000AF00F04|nr:hypothetical protein [Pseudomonas sp. NBRC 111128]